MTYRSIISSDLLQQHLDDPNWRIVDCRYNLMETDEGLSLYQMEHIPNAVYAHLARDLSSPASNNSGRHPLPDAEQFILTLEAWGIDNRKQVVVYDDAGGSFAARLWWMLRWLGHESVAVLDGGYSVWKQQGLPTTNTIPHFDPTTFTGNPDMGMLVNSDALQEHLGNSTVLLIDVRDPQRYSGQEEPIDNIAGHVPGAINIPWKNNVANNGMYLPRAQLHDQYSKLLEDAAGKDIVFMCGSGVTACHSLVAMEYIGITGAQLYPGSWSEWITDNNRPIATSED